MSDSEPEAHRPVLPIPQHSPPSDHISHGPPLTADHYLRLVRREAASLPNTFVASSAPPNAPKPAKSFLASSRTPPPPLFARPDLEWCDSLVNWFSSVQDAVAEARTQRVKTAKLQVPHVKDDAAWNIFITQSRGPLLNVVLALDFVSLVKILKMIDQSIHNVPTFTGHLTTEHKQRASVVADDFLRHRLDRWLFCVLACLKLPLSGNVTATLRSLLQKAASGRLGLKGAEDDRLGNLNVLITILGKYFGQDDAAQC